MVAGTHRLRGAKRIPVWSCEGHAEGVEGVVRTDRQGQPLCSISERASLSELLGFELSIGMSPIAARLSRSEVRTLCSKTWSLGWRIQTKA